MKNATIAKVVGVLVALSAFVVWGVAIVLSTKANYNYTSKYESKWNLAEKSSTIAAKQQHIAAFVAAIRNNPSDFASHDAIWLQTDDNSFQKNMEALETLKTRLDEISQLNPNSFEYNTAIQQITAQEQGEASAMLNVITNCYYRANYPVLCGWVGMLMFLMLPGVLILGGGVTYLLNDY
jgi:hypothetical protein